MFARFRPGDVVIYRKLKNSPHPGPHAKDIHPAPNGDDYSYSVEKHWRVIAVIAGSAVIVYTRRGKQHTLAVDDPNLRRAHWWERLVYWRRFPPARFPSAGPERQA